MDRERFEKQLNFILEIDKEKQILRQTHIRGYSRQEDDAEHAWHMAVMAFLLQEYSNEKIDIGRTMLMLLIHDLVEIDAGDTYAYDAEANKTKDEREHKAAERIYARQELERYYPDVNVLQIETAFTNGLRKRAGELNERNA